MNPHILVVEDEEALAMLLQYNLEARVTPSRPSRDGEEALTRWSKEACPTSSSSTGCCQVSGIEVCRRLRQRPETSNLPIIMLTARGEETDRMRGLDTGADDYIVKPFSMTELSARVRAVLRRASARTRGRRCSARRHRDRPGAHRVNRAARTVQLGPTEFRLLDYFMQHPGRVFSREQLLDGVWGSDVYVETAPSTCISAGCARRSTAATRPTRSAPCAALAMRSTIDLRRARKSPILIDFYPRGACGRRFRRSLAGW